VNVAPLYLSTVGLACPVGLTAPSACAAIRARINRFQESRYLDSEGEPIVCSELTRLPANLPPHERVQLLLGMAVTEAAQGFDGATLARIPLLVGTREPERPGDLSELLPEFLARMQAQHGLSLGATHSRAFPQGKTGGLRALAEARVLLLREPRLPGCLVAGVDSLINAPTLWWLNSQNRLKRSGQSDGVIPGEAAGCVLVTRQPLGPSLPVMVEGLGFAQEVATLDADEPLRATGLTRAARVALAEASLDMADIDFRISDASGEGYYFKEVALALARTLRVNKEAIPLWLPAESLGEIGAASAVVSLITATVAMRRGYAPGPRAIGYAAGHQTDRAAFVLHAHSMQARRSRA